MELRLLSTACTTSWTDWGHGELWLTPRALVRVPRRELTVRAGVAGARAAARGTAIGPDEPGAPGRDRIALDGDGIGALPVAPEAPVAVPDEVWGRYVATFADEATFRDLPLPSIERIVTRGGPLSIAVHLWLTTGRRQRLLLLRTPTAAAARALLEERLPS